MGAPFTEKLTEQVKIELGEDPPDVQPQLLCTTIISKYDKLFQEGL